MREDEKKRLRSNLIVLPKREPEQQQQMGQLELAECVAIENEIRLLLITLKEKRAHLRRRLKDRMEVEDGPLKSFAARIAWGRFP
jgi:hypothetical protein